MIVLSHSVVGVQKIEIFITKKLIDVYFNTILNHFRLSKYVFYAIPR